MAFEWADFARTQPLRASGCQAPKPGASGASRRGSGSPAEPQEAVAVGGRRHLHADATAQAVRVQVASYLAFFDHRYVSGLLGDYEDQGVGCQREAERRAVSRAEPFA